MGNQQESLVPKDWLPIPGLDGYYATGAGGIFSTRRSAVPRPLSLVPQYGRGKKLYVRVKAGGTTHLAHRLIASAKIGRRLRDGEIINHLNGDTKDNRVANLAVVSHRENVNHAVQNGLYCSGKEWHKARGMPKG